MTSPSTHRLSEIARHVIAPKGIVSTGWPAVRDTCSRLGWHFDPWQDGAGKLILSKRSDGLFAADLIAASIPRQVGKTFLFAAMTFAMCLREPGLTVIWTAHRAKTAKETFASMSGMAAQEKVAPHIANVARSRGDEAVVFTNGSRILFGAREAGFGRGFSNVGILVFDEAQILTESAMEDMVAAQNVAKNPLTILTGTPPRPRDPGEVFTMVRQDALNGDSEESLYIELSADREADLLDRSQWRRANPSFPTRTSERAMLRMRKNLSDDSFRREALGVWDEVSVHKPLVTPQRWKDMADIGPADDVAPGALGVDMSHGRDISVGACWIEDENAHLEQVWSGTDSAAAVEWVVERAGRRTPVVVDAASPAASLVPELKNRKCQVVVTTAANMAQACGLLENRIASDSLTHASQKQLTDAILGARRRPIRDAGGWALDRSDPTSSIYPIVAATLALFGATTHKRSKSQGKVVVLK
jgi:phage terminase large subunit-like protein